MRNIIADQNNSYIMICIEKPWMKRESMGDPDPSEPLLKTVYIRDLKKGWKPAIKILDIFLKSEYEYYLEYVWKISAARKLNDRDKDILLDFHDEIIRSDNFQQIPINYNNIRVLDFNIDEDKCFIVDSNLGKIIGKFNSMKIETLANVLVNPWLLDYYQPEYISAHIVKNYLEM